MKSSAARQSAIAVTPAAASLLTQLGTHYRLDLKFRVFAGGFDCAMLRVHDKDYPGDVLLDVGGAPVGICPRTFYAGVPLHIHCISSQQRRDTVELILSVNKRPTTILSLEKILERIGQPAIQTEEHQADTHYFA